MVFSVTGPQTKRLSSESTSSKLIIGLFSRSTAKPQLRKRKPPLIHGLLVINGMGSRAARMILYFQHVSAL